jgi:molybdopterin synthase sulfur carrier subunit
MRILYFAWVRQRVGLGEETVDLPANITTVAKLVDWLKALVPLDTPLAGAKEVAFFPPVTGG